MTYKVKKFKGYSIREVRTGKAKGLLYGQKGSRIVFPMVNNESSLRAEIARRS